MGYTPYKAKRMKSPMAQIKTIHESDSLYNKNFKNYKADSTAYANLGAKLDSLNKDFNKQDSTYRADVLGPDQKKIQNLQQQMGDDPRQSEVDEFNKAAKEFNAKHSRKKK